MKMIAKFVIQTITSDEYGEYFVMAPVCSDKPYGPNGESEDNTFARFTPSGELKMRVNNPDLYGKFKPGQKFYVNFTPVE